jgi:magnesium and cobalt transporter
MLRKLLNLLPKGRIKQLRDAAADQESLKASREKELIIKNLMQLNSLTAQDVMVPRSDVTWINASMPVEKVLTYLKDFSHTRYPLCHQTLDNVLGIIHIKDVIMAEPTGNLKKHIEKALFVSPTMSCVDLLIKMRQDKKYIAIVVDEFGGVDGLVTGDALIEKLVDHLGPDSATDKALYMYDPKSRSLGVDGRLSITEFEKNFGTILTDKERESDPETLAGLVLLLIGRIPNRGEIIRHSTGVTFEIKDVHARGIRKMRIYNLGVLNKPKA